jgi:hypothetical protein
MSPKLLRNLLFAALAAGYVFYGLRYIEATSVTIEGEKYYVLFDDAMISMRYAYNLARGLGPVWNAGERVEGFTNPLWVGWMALFHLFPIPLSKTGFYIQLGGLVFMTCALYFVRKIVEEFTDDVWAMLAAVAFTAFYNPLHSWALLGMEVSVLTLLLTISVYLALRAAPSRFPLWTYVLLAVSTLFRLDMAAPFIVVFAAMFIVQKEYRRQHILWGLGLLALFLGIQAIARYAYYGEWLPNTYYLKVTGWPFVLRILRGFYALAWFIYYTNWVLFLVPFALLLFRRDWKINLLLSLFLGQMAYSVYVGGDAWEHHGGANRYLAVAMPLFFAVFACGIEVLRQKAAAGFGSRKEAALMSRFAWLAVFTVSLLNFNLLLGDWRYIERLTFARKPDYVAGNERNLQIALALQNATQPGASVAVVGAGTIPYFLPDRYAIDILGKADPYIAHQPVRAPMSIVDIPNMRPGHMKWDYEYTLGQLRPDVVVSIWEGTSAEAAPYLERDYVYAAIAPGVKVYLLKDSPKILWDRVNVK